jgi:hypothetical protein
MTQDKARKAAARQRMTQTGEPYSVARRAVRADAEDRETLAGAEQPGPGRPGADLPVPGPGRPVTTPAGSSASPDPDWDTLTPEELYAREAAEAGVGPEQAAANLDAFRIRELAEQARRVADDARDRADRARERADREEEAAGEAEDRAGLADEEAELAMEAGGPRAEQRSRELADRAQEAADQARERADAAEEAAGEAEGQADELEELAAAYAERASQPGPAGRRGSPGHPADRGQSWRRRQWGQLLGRSHTAPRPPAFLPAESPRAPGAPHPPAPPRPPRLPRSAREG